MELYWLLLVRMEIKVPISIGELVDKITILEIKKDKILDNLKFSNIHSELIKLNLIYNSTKEKNKNIDFYYKSLKKINAELWDIEENIRDCERRKDFGNEFIELSRKIYFKNDLRYEIKNKINKELGSQILEEKSYKK